MNTPTPPWCLHWSSDGELAWGDRIDVIQRLLAHEPAIAHSIPKPLTALQASVTRQRLKKPPSCTHS